MGPEKTEKIVHPMPRRAVNRGEFLFLWASHFPMAEKQQSIQDRQIRFQEEWAEVQKVFTSFQEEDPVRRIQILGRLFEVLSPWIERGIRTTVLHHFLLLPTEMVLARIFAKAARRNSMPESYQGFLMWIESRILEDLADADNSLGATNGAYGEPPAVLQKRFNALPFSDRALLYLYMIEGFDVPEVVKYTGIPSKTAASALDRVWIAIGGNEEDSRIPDSWRKCFEGGVKE